MPLLTIAINEMNNLKKITVKKVLIVLISIVVIYTIVNSIRYNFLAKAEADSQTAAPIYVGGWSLPPGGASGGTGSGMGPSGGSYPSDDGGDFGDLGSGFSVDWDHGPVLVWTLIW